MSNQRPSFAKRDREMKLKDKARAKAERRAARRAEPRTGHGPPIAAAEPELTASTGEAEPSPAAPATSATPVPTRPR